MCGTRCGRRTRTLTFPRRHKFSSHAALPLNGGAKLGFGRGNSFGGEFDLITLEGDRLGTGDFRGYDGYHVLKLAARQPVSPGMFTTSGFAGLIDVSQGGSFNELGVGFVGFKFDVGNGTQYGWVRIKTTQAGPRNQLVVEDYAWADPGEPILTGQKTASDSAVTDQGSLGLLALGASGLAAWRKSRLRTLIPAAPWTLLRPTNAIRSTSLRTRANNWQCPNQVRALPDRMAS